LQYTDAELVAAACRGDLASFGRLYERHYRLAVGITRSRLSDGHLAEDAFSCVRINPLEPKGHFMRTRSVQMLLHGNFCAVVVACVLIVAGSSGSVIADEPIANWLRGAGKDVQIRLRGEVLEADGQPASDFQVTGRMNAVASNPQIEAKVDGHRFEFWIPVNQSKWYSMRLKAASTQGDRVAYQIFNTSELRQLAIDGIKLTLRPPTRKVQVKVIEKDQPVAGAYVKAAVGFGIELRTRTNADGVARFGLVPDQKLSGLMAWTDDFRIGGFGFDGKPARDPDTDEHVVELSRCRNQKLRFIDENGSTVPGVDFVIQMATAPPNYNFIGTNEYSSMTTDAAGEVIDKWFPEWDEHHFYAELRSDRWILDGDHRTIEDTVVFKLKKSKIADRKRVTGRVVSTSTAVGGFFVRLDSFQGEQENYSDEVWAFTDAEGAFSVDVLPDATYCAYVLDSRWVSEIKDLIPYQTSMDQITPPELSVSEGETVEVIVTSGPEKRPFPNLAIYFRREHHYRWREGSETRQGTGGPQWWATTDGSGRVITRTVPGKLKASVYTPIWRTEQTSDVVSGERAKILLHREVDERQKVTGRLILPEGLESNLKDAEIRFGSVDGNYDEEQTLTCSEDGSFSFETLSTKIGIFASTKDGRAASSLVVKTSRLPIEMHLRPTMDFHGQLLGDGDRPLPGRQVWAIVRVDGKKGTSFDAKRIEARTDEQGNYTLRGLPIEMKASLQVVSVDDSTQTDSLDEIYLELNESRLRAVSRLTKVPSPIGKKSLADRYKATLRDCARSGFHLMVILGGNGDQVTEFINRNLIDYETNKEAYPFMQLVISGGSLSAVDLAFVKEHKWNLPGDGRVVAHAIDGKGNELGRREFDVATEAAVESTADFLHRHAPPKVDGVEKWRKAFADAKRSHRRVWARIGQKYCGPCHALGRWIDDHRGLLEKDFVFLKIDDFYDEYGDRVAQRLTRGEHHSIPFYAIFDEDGKLLIDSVGPLGNIGYPSGFEGQKQLRKMLLQTRRNLTDDEIKQLVESVGE
jgi:hypothetical protein